MMKMLVKHSSKVILSRLKTSSSIFLLGGYYSIRYPTYRDTIPINLRFIVLNTVMFQSMNDDIFDSNEAMEQIK